MSERTINPRAVAPCAESGVSRWIARLPAPLVTAIVGAALAAAAGFLGWSLATGYWTPEHQMQEALSVQRIPGVYMSYDKVAGKGGVPDLVAYFDFHADPVPPPTMRARPNAQAGQRVRLFAEIRYPLLASDIPHIPNYIARDADRLPRDGCSGISGSCRMFWLVDAAEWVRLDRMVRTYGALGFTGQSWFERGAVPGITLLLGAAMLLGAAPGGAGNPRRLSAIVLALGTVALIAVAMYQGGQFFAPL